MAARSSSTLTVALPSDREIVMTRVFDAPRALVFEAHTKPEHLRHWWGPRSSTLPVCEMDFRPGGAYRFVQRDADGTEYGFRGVFREIVPPERLVYTFEFEGAPGHVSIETLSFVEQAGRTTLTSSMVFDPVEDRDGMLKSGMEEGASETMDRLAEYLETMA
ncbi:MAG: SRPBCC family protein [Gemmatimonadaceae bacterium]